MLKIIFGEAQEHLYDMELETVSGGSNHFCLRYCMNRIWMQGLQLWFRKCPHIPVSSLWLLSQCCGSDFIIHCLAVLGFDCRLPSLLFSLKRDKLINENWTVGRHRNCAGMYHGPDFPFKTMKTEVDIWQLFPVVYDLVLKQCCQHLTTRLTFLIAVTHSIGMEAGMWLSYCTASFPVAWPCP